MSKAFKNKIRDERTIDFLFSVKIRSSIVDIRVDIIYTIIYSISKATIRTRDDPSPPFEWDIQKITLPPST